MAIAIRIPEELEKRLEVLARAEKRSKSFMVREAIEAYVEDMEDYKIGMRALSSIKKTYSLEEVEKICGLED